MKKVLYLVLTAGLLAGCVDSLDDYNVDTKRASIVTPETLYTSALRSMSDILTTPNVNSNNFRLYAQHWTTTTYLDEPRYIMTSRIIPQNFWDAMYRDVIADLREAKRILTANELINPEVKKNQMAQLEIIEVYAWAALVNTFGDVPYSEALDFKNSLPKYDKASTIYNDLLTRLDAAIAMLNADASGFGAGELLYAAKAGGDRMAHWIRFANSVKLKLGMIIADVDPAKAATLVQQASLNVFESNDDNARFPYIADPPNNNPIATNLNPDFTSRQDFIAANTIVDKMNALSDPRRPFYFTTINNNFVGGVYGYENTYADFSTINPTITSPDFESLILDYSEVKFLLAEAAERGFIAGSAETHYNEAIAASILYWGGNEDMVSAYLSQPSVAYTTAGANWREKIGTQKWIALFNRGWDSWMEWKRLDYPQLAPPSGPAIPSALRIPVRLIYPINEQTLNGANRSAAAASIGGDDATTKLFWDVN